MGADNRTFNVRRSDDYPPAAPELDARREAMRAALATRRHRGAPVTDRDLDNEDLFPITKAAVNAALDVMEMPNGR